jgi:mannosyltransferase OCH1-like enzyme
MRTFGIYTKVPLNIFQAGINKNFISPNLRINNPEFNYFYFDENDCENFIFNNYPINIYNAYKSLIPFEYKIDLWKYCILYKYGGIYIDDKYDDNIKLIELIDHNFFVNNKHHYYNKLLINTDFIISKINNPILNIAINEIVKNVNINYYGIDFSYPTGSGLLGKLFKENNLTAHLYYNEGNIKFKNIIIMKTKKNYQDNNNSYYLWMTKKIYNKQK